MIDPLLLAHRALHKILPLSLALRRLKADGYQRQLIAYQRDFLRRLRDYPNGAEYRLLACLQVTPHSRAYRLLAPPGVGHQCSYTLLLDWYNPETEVQSLLAARGWSASQRVRLRTASSAFRPGTWVTTELREALREHVEIRSPAAVFCPSPGNEPTEQTAHHGPRLNLAAALARLSTVHDVSPEAVLAHQPRSLGRGREARARSIAAVTIMANAVLSLFIALVLLVAGPMLVKLINTPAEIVDDAVLYINVIAVAMTFNGFLMAAVSALRAFAQVKTILVLGIFANVLYIVLEYVLIYGYGPIPELGVFGSALATLSVRVSGVLLLIWVLARNLQLRYRTGMSWKRLAPLVKRLFNLSYPSVMDNVAYGFYQLFLVSFIAGLGVATVLSRSYTLTLTAFLTLIALTISQGNEVLVGYLYGAGRHTDVYWRAMRSAGIAVLMATGISAVIYLFAAPLIGLFTDDAEIHRMATKLLLLTIFLVVTDSVDRQK